MVDSLISEDTFFTDLLYFEGIIFSRPYLSGVIDDVLNKFKDADLLIEWTDLLGQEDKKNIPNLSNPIVNGKLFFAKLERNVRTVANTFVNQGFNVVPRYRHNAFNESFSPGNQPLLSIIYSQLPVIDTSSLNHKYFIEFLLDEETQKKRRRFFAWKNDIENKIENGSLKIEHVPDLIATHIDDYTSWLKKTDLKLKYEKREMVYYFLTSIMTMIKLPEGIKKLFEFKKRKLDLLDDEKVSGRELAYIVHAQRELS